MTKSDAATGRFANNLKVSTETLSAWQGLVERNGGTADDATSSFQSLSDSIQQLKVTGQSSILPFWARIQAEGGKALNYNKALDQTYLDLADDLSAIAKTDPARANYLGRQLGLTQAMVNVMMKGRAETEKQLALEKKIGVETEAQKQAAIDRQPAWADLRRAGERFGDTILTIVTPALLKVDELLERFVIWAREHIPQIEQAFKDAFAPLEPYLKPILEAMKAESSKFAAETSHEFRLLKAVFSGAAGDIRDAWKQLMADMKDDLKGFAGDLVLTILSGFKAAFNGSISWLYGRLNTITEAITGKKLFPEEIYTAPQMNPAGGGVTGLRGALHRQTGAAGAAAGGATPSGAGGPATGAGGRGGAGAQNYSGTNAAVVKQAAADIGTTPENLATVISCETEGTFSPSIVGGTGGRYMGLIQFGIPERKEFGADANQTFAEQMGAVVRYIKKRGFKPGMDLTDLYSTINAGSPGHPYASDGHGRVIDHVARMRNSERARVNRFLESGDTTSTTPGEARVAGGPVTAGRRYLVGERGPEYFLPGRSGEILPNSLLAAMAAKGFAGFLPPNLGAAMAANVATHNSTVNSHNRSQHEVNIANMSINTSATDASGLARDIKPALERASYAMLANFSLA